MNLIVSNIENDTLNPILFQECGKTFKCDDLSCAFTKETTSSCFSRTKFKPQSIRNNGMNRLSCFSCDHDICDRLVSASQH